MKSVPDAYLGVWRRRLLTTTAGLRDETSEVYWLQTASLHADLRLPRPQALPPAASLETCSHAQQLALSEQAGFAGITEVNGLTEAREAMRRLRMTALLPECQTPEPSVPTVPPAPGAPVPGAPTPPPPGQPQVQPTPGAPVPGQALPPESSAADATPLQPEEPKPGVNCRTVS